MQSGHALNGVTAVQRLRPRGTAHPGAQRNPELPGNGLQQGPLHAGAVQAALGWAG